MFQGIKSTQTFSLSTPKNSKVNQKQMHTNYWICKYLILKGQDFLDYCSQTNVRSEDWLNDKPRSRLVKTNRSCLLTKLRWVVVQDYPFILYCIKSRSGEVTGKTPLVLRQNRQPATSTSTSAGFQLRSVERCPKQTVLTFI